MTGYGSADAEIWVQGQTVQVHPAARVDCCLAIASLSFERGRRSGQGLPACWAMQRMMTALVLHQFVTVDPPIEQDSPHYPKQS